MSKFWFVLALDLIGWKDGARFLDQSQASKGKCKHSRNTFDTRLKIAPKWRIYGWPGSLIFIIFTLQFDGRQPNLLAIRIGLESQRQDWTSLIDLTLGNNVKSKELLIIVCGVCEWWSCRVRYLGIIKHLSYIPAYGKTRKGQDTRTLYGRTPCAILASSLRAFNLRALLASFRVRENLI